jgi:hypothetical protein
MYIIYRCSKTAAKTLQYMIKYAIPIEAKLGQICQSYDVINIFSKWEVTIPIRLFDKAFFLDYKNQV